MNERTNEPLAHSHIRIQRIGGVVVEPKRDEAEHKENPQTRSKIGEVPNQKKESKASKKETHQAYSEIWSGRHGRKYVS